MFRESFDSKMCLPDDFAIKTEFGEETNRHKNSF